MASVSQNMAFPASQSHQIASKCIFAKEKNSDLESYPSDPHTKIPKNSAFLIVDPFKGRGTWRMRQQTIFTFLTINRLQGLNQLNA